jgi:hypothetical protein
LVFIEQNLRIRLDLQQKIHVFGVAADQNAVAIERHKNQEDVVRKFAPVFAANFLSSREDVIEMRGVMSTRPRYPVRPKRWTMTLPPGKIVEIVRPLLHHATPLGEVLGVIVGGANLVAFVMGKLAFDPIGMKPHFV